MNHALPNLVTIDGYDGFIKAVDPASLVDVEQPGCARFF